MYTSVMAFGQCMQYVFNGAPTGKSYIETVTVSGTTASTSTQKYSDSACTTVDGSPTVEAAPITFNKCNAPDKDNTAYSYYSLPVTSNPIGSGSTQAVGRYAFSTSTNCLNKTPYTVFRGTVVGACIKSGDGKTSLKYTTATSTEYTYQQYSDTACKTASGAAQTTTYGTSTTCQGPNYGETTTQTAYMTEAAATLAVPGGTTPTSAPTAASTCFASTETVQLEDGSVKALSEVQLGDRILTAGLNGSIKGFSPVIAVPHAGEASTAATFVQLSTAEKDIKMTADHLLLAGSCSASAALPLVQARSVSVGDCLQTAEGKAAVTAVRSVQGKGLSSAVTLAGDLIVVNGIAASPFAVNHRIGEAWYVIHRALFTVLPAALGLSFFQKTSERFGDLAVQFSL